MPLSKSVSPKSIGLPMPREPEDLPLCVFLDTQVYRATSFDWNAGNFAMLRERVARGSIELVTTEITRQEIRRGIREVLNEFAQDVRKIRHTALVRQLKADHIDAVASLKSAKLDVEKIWTAADEFLADLQTTLLEPPTSAFDELFKLYFSGSPPFGAKGKKSEFPDAANLLTLTHHSQLTGKKIYIVSGDGDWKRVCEKHPSLICVEHLSEIIDKVIRAEWRSDDLWSDEELLGFLAAKMNLLKPMLQSALESNSRVNLGDGSIDHFDLEDVDLVGLAITHIEDDDDDITFSGELFHNVYYSADISLEDEELLNTIEHQLSGRAELVAEIRLVLPINNPENIKIEDVWYSDGLELEVPLKY